MQENEFQCNNQRLAAWLMLHHIKLLYTEQKSKLIFVFEADERIAALVKEYNKILN